MTFRPCRSSPDSGSHALGDGREDLASGPPASTPAGPPRTCNGVVLVALIPSLLAACGLGTPPPQGGLDHPLPPCPGTPNCVRSPGVDGETPVPPFLLAEGTAPSVEAMSAALESLPRTRVVQREVGAGGAFYLHAESRSRILRFVDDVELRWTPGLAALEVRSASRVGRSDLGVNARRLDALRDRLAKTGTLATTPSPALGGEEGDPPD